MTRYYDVRGDTSGTDEDNTLNIWYQEGGEPDDLMPVRHRHNAVELNYIAEGTVTYIFFGHPVRIEAERLALFWGSIPHRIVEIHKPLSFYSMHIPLALFLDSGLPEEFVHRLLGGQVAVEVNGEQAQRDLLLFRQWHADLTDPKRTNEKPVVLEIQARLHRLAESLHDDVLWSIARPALTRGDQLARVTRMAQFIAENYADALSVEHVAEHVDLHPKYASQVFHQNFGITVKRYITLNRIHRAQFLLLSTDASVLDIAIESGFGSASQFYAAFKAHCNQTPLDFRRSVRASEGAGPST